MVPPACLLKMAATPPPLPSTSSGDGGGVTNFPYATMKNIETQLFRIVFYHCTLCDAFWDESATAPVYAKGEQ